MLENFIKKYISKKGSFTVEASIVFSAVFLMISVSVYLFIIMYQYAFLQSVADSTANTGAYIYVNQNAGDYTNANNSDLYWRIFDRAAEAKKNRLNNYIEKLLKRDILNSERYFDNFICSKSLIKQLNVSVEERFPLPVGKLFEIFSIPPTLSLKAEAISPFDDNAEFIRNLDLIIDIKNCISNSDNKWIGKDSELNGVLNKLIKSK